MNWPAIWQALKDVLVALAAYLSGRSAARADAVADERDALVQRQDREADVDRLSRPELLERMHDTDDRVRAVQARAAKRR